MAQERVLSIRAQSARATIEYVPTSPSGLVSLLSGNTLDDLAQLPKVLDTTVIQPNSPAIFQVSTPGFYGAFENGDVDLEALEENDGEAEGEDSGYSLLVSGAPIPLVPSVPFQVQFAILDPSGALVPVDGSARLILLDAAGNPASFPYEIEPATVAFSSGMATSTVIVMTEANLEDVELMLLPEETELTQSRGLATALPKAGGPPLGVVIAAIRRAWPVPEHVARKVLEGQEALNAYLTELRSQSAAKDSQWHCPLSFAARTSGSLGEERPRGGSPVGRIHAGTDLAGDPGTTVWAARDGMITSRRQLGPPGPVGGWQMLVDHGDGTWARYLHLDSVPMLMVPVKAGKPIGEVNSRGTHLHFEIIKGTFSTGTFFMDNKPPGDTVNPIPSEYPFIGAARNLFQSARLPSKIFRCFVTHIIPAALSEDAPNGTLRELEAILNPVSPLPALSTGKTYVLCQAAIRAAKAPPNESPYNALAPWKIDFAPESPASPANIAFDTRQKADRYLPANNPSKAGLAMYAHYNTEASQANMHRYWFAWNTAGYAGSPKGPRRFKLDAINHFGESLQDAYSFKFGPLIKGVEASPSTGDSLYRVTIIPHLGSDLGPMHQNPDRYKLTFTGPGHWQHTDEPECLTEVVSEHQQELVFFLVRPAPCSPEAREKFTVRAESVMIPDIAHEIEVDPMIGQIEITPSTYIVDAGENVFFTRNRLNADGTRTAIPITYNSWGHGFSNWPGSPINGLSETGIHFSYAFQSTDESVVGMPGGLQANRHGTWTLKPLGGGCVTIKVNNDLLVFTASRGVNPCKVQVRIDGTAIGIVTEGGNRLGGRLIGFCDVCGGSAFRPLLPPGDHQMTFEDQTTYSPGEYETVSVVFGAFGGITPAVGSINLAAEIQVRTVKLTVPRVPGDPPQDPP